MAKSGLGVTDFTEPEAPSASPGWEAASSRPRGQREPFSGVCSVQVGGLRGSIWGGGDGHGALVAAADRPCPHRVSLGLALSPLRERMALAAPPSAAGLELGDFLREAEQTLQVTRALGCVCAAVPAPGRTRAALRRS